MQDSLLVGIDVSLKSNKVRILHPDGTSLSKFTVNNSVPGAKTISERITKIAQNKVFENIMIGMESTSVYGDPLAYFLKQDVMLNKFNTSIHVLNPKQVNKFKLFYPDLPKTDDIDAWIIAEHLRFGRINKELYFDENQKALQKLTRARFHTIHNLTREKNWFLNNLFLKFSSLAQDKIFSNRFGATSTSLIEDFFSVDEISYMPLEELALFINKKGKNHFKDPDEIAACIQKAARSSYRLPKTVLDSVNQVLAVSLTAMKAYKEQLRIFDKAIETQAKIIPNTLTSIKGVGPVYSSGIIAEIGDIHRFKDHAAFAKFAGIAWTKHQSGDFLAAHTRLINSGNRYLRYYLTEAANLVRMHDPEYKRFYNLKYSQTPKTPHKRALALTARKFARLVYALLHSNRLYTPPIW
jgi:transposase